MESFTCQTVLSLWDIQKYGNLFLDCDILRALPALVYNFSQNAKGGLSVRKAGLGVDGAGNETWGIRYKVIDS